MSEFALNLPVNGLSFGNVSQNILKEIQERGLNPSIFLIGGQPDLSAFKITPEYAQWLQTNVNKAVATHNRKTPTFKLWHINQSLESFSEKQYLMTFWETSSPTPFEINILKNQERVFVTSKHTKSTLEDVGIKNITYIPLGFDSTHFYNTNKKYFQDDRIVFYLAGKLENRKATLKTLRAWVKKYGNNHKYHLHCSITNPFLKPEQMNAMIGQALEGVKYWNVNFLPFVKTNAELNEVHNSIDIHLGTSLSEGFNLPLFNSLALGKHAVSLNAHVHKDYCNDENSVLLSPNGKISCIDNMFFHANSPFNQGEFYNFDDDEFIDCCELAIKRVEKNRVNEAGKKLQEWTYKKTVDKILEEIK